MFFFKRKKVVLDTFTYDVSYYEHAKPQKATNFYPNWWKGVPKTSIERTQNGLDIERPTIKSCPGFTDFYRKGIIIPLWSDLVIETHENGSYTYAFADPTSQEIVSHTSEQTGSQLSDLINIKLNPPWRFLEKTGIYFACIEPTWNYLDRNITMNILPGLVQYNINTSTAVNMFVPKDHQRLEFVYGDPLYHFIPLTEKELEIKHHLISKKEYDKLNNWSFHRFKFRNNHVFKKKMVKQCPFKF
jgi:hypothetical protein